MLIRRSIMLMWERAWQVLHDLVVTHSGLKDLTFFCREAGSLGLQLLQSRLIGQALVETHC